MAWDRRQSFKDRALWLVLEDLLIWLLCFGQLRKKKGEVKSFARMSFLMSHCNIFEKKM